MNTIDDILRRFAAETPEAPALSFRGETLSYAVLDRRTNALADSLAGAGVGRGDRVAFIGRNRAEHFELIFAAAKLGAISVGLNWRLSERELAAQLRDCDPVLIFAAPENRALVLGALGESGAATRPAFFEDEYAAMILDGDPSPRPKVAAPQDLCMICYTSGTTGAAKGVTFTHGSLWDIFPGAAAAWDFNSSSVSLICMPTFHTAGACWGLLALSQGGHDVVVQDFDPQAVVELMAGMGVTNSMFAPIMLEQVIGALEKRPELKLSRLRTILYGAAPISEPVLARALAAIDCRFVQGYGLTEINGTITNLGADDHVLEGEAGLRLRSAGKAVPWGAVRVVDPETGRDKATGEVGEVWGRSPGMMQSYWQRPADTEAAITPDGWLRTGDAGYLDADGYLFLTDRIKDMIVTGGENVYPVEVENVLAAHPAVKAVAVIGVPDPKWGETVKAVIEPRAALPSPEEIIEWARARLARYKCPTSVDFIAEMPRNASGKILKRSLRERYWSGRDRRIG